MREIKILPTTTLAVGANQSFEMSLPDFQTVSRMDLYVRVMGGDGTISTVQMQPKTEDGDIMYGYTTFTNSGATQARFLDAPAAPTVVVKLNVATDSADVMIVAVVYD